MNDFTGGNTLNSPEDELSFKQVKEGTERLIELLEEENQALEATIGLNAELIKEMVEALQKIANAEAEDQKPGDAERLMRELLLRAAAERERIERETRERAQREYEKRVRERNRRIRRDV